MERVAAIAATALAVLGIAAVLAAADDPSDGAKLYSDDCAKCHGMDGGADTAAGKALKAAALNDPRFADIDASTVGSALHGNPKHAAVAAKVGDADLELLAAHIRELAARAPAPTPEAGE